MALQINCTPSLTWIELYLKQAEKEEELLKRINLEKLIRKIFQKKQRRNLNNSTEKTDEYKTKEITVPL